ncbi:MAG TPA: ATP-binding protein [Gemmatimonadaceae bacterium]|nr:ATP-binding protein [Gemmatimonadaceae bacterium]
MGTERFADIATDSSSSPARLARSKPPVTPDDDARAGHEGPTLEAALDDLIHLIEYQIPSMRGSVLLLDEDGMTMRHGAAPSLPADYSAQIDGLQIGPAAGSCGTAAYRGQQVIVEDIASDPLWQEYRHLALPHELRACWSTPIFDDNGSVIGTFAMYYDSPRVPTKLELELTEIAAQLASTIIIRARVENQLRSARAEAERANRVKSDFLAMMSHELRTPLNAIGGYAKLMLEGIPTPVSDAHEDYLRRIVKAQSHLLSVIEAILMHAKLEAGRMTYELVDFRFSEVLDPVETLIIPQLKAKQIEFDFSQCDRNLWLHADRQKVVQILLNLLSNAVKFTASGGRVSTAACARDEKVVVTVADTGIGMTAAQVAVAFEPFVQFDNRLTQKESGTGLGLPISRELARAMGGDLVVTSEEGVGSEFVLTLPRAEAPASTPANWT